MMAGVVGHLVRSPIKFTNSLKVSSGWLVAHADGGRTGLIFGEL